jgi:LacI family transcriptional regulator
MDTDGPKKSTRVTLQDVASAARVSTATVSRYFNNRDALRPETIRQVERAIETLGYYPDLNARALASRRPSTLGAIIPTTENAIFAEGVEAMQSWLMARDIMLMTVSTRYDSEVEFEQVRRLVAHGVGGLMLIGNARPAKTIEFIRTHNIPFCTAWSFQAESTNPQIGFNNFAAAYKMGEQILKKGHRTIGVIGGLTQDNDRATDRIKGISQCFADHGFPIPQERILETPYQPEDSATALDELLRRAPEVTVIFCGNDVLAAGALHRAQDRGIDVPGQISITGFDDIGLAKILQPQLTTVHLPHRFMGEMAAQALYDAVIHNEPVKSLEMPFSIRERGTLGTLE